MCEHCMTKSRKIFFHHCKIRSRLLCVHSLTPLSSHFPPSSNFNARPQALLLALPRLPVTLAPRLKAAAQQLHPEGGEQDRVQGGGEEEEEEEEGGG